ncbi:hypothetical protein [Gluconobacter sp. Gdi]|uniref:hypothetical protein n=1 Tax=Gluconobacter sp. Gdi TaxID=2691888 RepID=UPI00175E19B8|nr:hypothetical protein [Gluconobacter sp. Gdi]GFE98084.1 hypothetical protein DmGdi_31570 [Gluconobacter sp. Gdi]
MTVSVYGGIMMLELGPSGDVEYFFRCINYFVETPKKILLPLITDRLYKRYVVVEDFAELRENFVFIESIFKNTEVLSCDFEEYIVGEKDRRLNPKEPTLDLLFKTYFSSFKDCMKTAESTKENFGTYVPLIIGRDIVAPKFAVGKNDSKGEKIRERYDALEGNPLWWGA